MRRIERDLVTNYFPTLLLQEIYHITAKAHRVGGDFYIRGRRPHDIWKQDIPHGEPALSVSAADSVWRGLGAVAYVGPLVACHSWEMEIHSDAG